MHYVYLSGKPVPADIAASVQKVPPNISEKFPQGGFFTADGTQVTAIKDAADGKDPFNNPFQATAFTKVDLIQEIRDQLNRIEELVK